MDMITPVPESGRHHDLALRLRDSFGGHMAQPDAVAACVQQAIRQYFADLDGETPAGIYDMVLKSVERPLIQEVLDKAGGNQSKAAEWLGLNRNTLRKKMKEHGLL